MVELDGQEYTLQTPQENATQAIAWVNQYCIDNNVKNLQGEVVSIEQAPGSPLYLIFLGFTYLATMCQNLIFGLGRMLNLGSASNRQLVTLGEIVRMRRKPPTYTTIRALVYAMDDTDCSILTTLTAKIQVGGQQITFSPLFNLTIPQGTAGVVLLQATALGSFFIPAGTLQQFDVPPAGFSSMSTQASVPGRPQESFSQFRRRLQQRSIANSAIENCIEALRNLPGVSAANIYFNYSNVIQTIQDYAVPARTALAFIQGYNAAIAQTIFSYLLCDMVQLSLSQDVTLHSGQIVTAYWDTPVNAGIMIRLLIRNTFNVAMTQQLISAIQSLTLQKDVAATVTTAEVIAVCQTAVPDAIIDGAELRRADGEFWGQRVTAGSNEIFEFNRSNIEVVNETT